VGSSAAMWKSHRVLLADKEISLAGTAFELIREKANQAYRAWATRNGRIRDFILTGRQIVGRVRRVGHALVRFALQLRALACAQSERCRGSRTRDPSKDFPWFRIVQHGTNFRAWMFRILKNTFLSSWSKLERRMTVAMDSEGDEHELPVDTETPETMLMNRDARQHLQPRPCALGFVESSRSSSSAEVLGSG
jgi:hypothetical protein